ncbi:mediator of rna polymerase ii transcription subunit 4 [Ophiostoma piceae UAMH 11346]|uniref:Mediator of RNA polymerase II transcription subunit 4 n=1 Tax=Ophiostoma piceae (strain UAMH 11346) TaxID=1262450 RepID=S3D026_OPHP1|nr:mediator of rna polymerase ii transcription subunit 4 [Ophiostoma piceae UAMH 11346]
MDKFIDARFDRVEKALAVLIDSIANYNPSPALAEDLLTADRELSGGLLKLQDHQNNHLRILSLRAEVAALDNQIKSTIQTLANSRRDMLQTPATIFPDDNTDNLAIRDQTKHYPFTYDQLMSYARRISRNTVPGQGQTDGSEYFAQFGLTSDNVAAAAAAANGTNGVDQSMPGTAAPTPAPTTPGIAATPGPASAATPGVNGTPAPNSIAPTGAAAADTTQSVTAPTVPDLPQDLQRYVSPMVGTIFSPWPMPDLMQQGALRTLNTLSEAQYRGPPAQYTSTPPVPVRFVSLEEQEEEERQKTAREAEEREAREERQRRMEEAAAAGARHSGGGGGGYSHGGASAQPAAPRQFASALDMDDDDD